MNTFLSVLFWLAIALFIGILIAMLSILFVNRLDYVDGSECFDCGIDPLGSCRVPFALHFLLVCIVFVVFDAEMLLCLPIVVPVVHNAYWWFWLFFLFLLYLGLVFEMFIQTIDWNE